MFVSFQNIKLLGEYVYFLGINSAINSRNNCGGKALKLSRAGI